MAPRVSTGVASTSVVDAGTPSPAPGGCAPRPPRPHPLLRGGLSPRRGGRPPPPRFVLRPAQDERTVVRARGPRPRIAPHPPLCGGLCPRRGGSAPPPASSFDRLRTSGLSSVPAAPALGLPLTRCCASVSPPGEAGASRPPPRPSTGSGRADCRPCPRPPPSDCPSPAAARRPLPQERRGRPAPRLVLRPAQDERTVVRARGPPPSDCPSSRRCVAACSWGRGGRGPRFKPASSFDRLSSTGLPSVGAVPPDPRIAPHPLLRIGLSHRERREPLEGLRVIVRRAHPSRGPSTGRVMVRQAHHERIGVVVPLPSQGQALPSQERCPSTSSGWGGGARG